MGAVPRRSTGAEPHNGRAIGTPTEEPVLFHADLVICTAGGRVRRARTDRLQRWTRLGIRGGDLPATACAHRTRAAPIAPGVVAPSARPTLFCAGGSVGGHSARARRRRRGRLGVDGHLIGKGLCVRGGHSVGIVVVLRRGPATTAGASGPRDDVQRAQKFESRGEHWKEWPDRED